MVLSMLLRGGLEAFFTGGISQEGILAIAAGGKAARRDRE
jgi:hypothetical protein